MEYAVGRDEVAGLYLTSPPLLAATPHRNQKIRVRWVSFQTRGADQGCASLGGEGTYHNSHTWYAASILRPIAGMPLVGDRSKISPQSRREVGDGSIRSQRPRLKYVARRSGRVLLDWIKHTVDARMDVFPEQVRGVEYAQGVVDFNLADVLGEG
ncbi:predicted protein [Chaetomium globosum CBS 148.51]|uniref:Uncharacterized protein n=1 Tax=Chaetomium globosum (strain ATCC 6205 / CBS 148.51 / DSM 1962 / NBRC 6347 / NRRL 1970) TaxID=306901 RepID=Q2H253_CHAGB|nr:uncharacterized protein CHGG_04143 [Chaetomium globosum CBS 148.51]EAQ87524.1 predicted protein [Chaetomium globosum CBS 148.51]